MCDADELTTTNAVLHILFMPLSLRWVLRMGVSSMDSRI